MFLSTSAFLALAFFPLLLLAAPHHSPCQVSFNGYQLSSPRISHHDIHDIPHLLVTIADSLPKGLTFHRIIDESSPELPDIIPAAVTVTVPTSAALGGADSFIAVGQLKSHHVWSLAQKNVPSVLQHMASMVERTRLDVSVAQGRPVVVYIAMPGFAVTPF
ncbi:hypothetical protein BC834DRAFT_439756 [Gloeopeniophorella convolvens]|nr:hypothetical protein BC834DRAFT_439756 [Gloeopeniophorella convolvens]